MDAHGKSKNAHLQNNCSFQISDSGLLGNWAFQEILSEWFHLLGFSNGKTSSFLHSFALRSSWMAMHEITTKFSTKHTLWKVPIQRVELDITTDKQREGFVCLFFKIEESGCATCSTNSSTLVDMAVGFPSAFRVVFLLVQEIQFLEKCWQF